MSMKVTDAMIDAVLEHRREESRKLSENPDYGMCACMGPIPVRETDGRIPTRRCQCVRSTIAKEIAAALEVAE
ncbi:hypothetical protein [Ruegeria sp. HKCCD6109]|uniref:hypothetical protein n=1 Tax=Ruegeria sp. HKCCD6109 TaxID=2683017 RepID=UPI0014917B34|nr:hypothetical protein [Ruegeria sp. HKCCD6109]NOD65757.1 hypothetical protein [Ruegeria sp. HKCCD6109]